MNSFSGKFEYLGETGNVLQGGGCRLTIDETACRIVPEKGEPLAMDLGDIDVFSPGDYELNLKLYTGKSVCLHHFAKTFDDMRNAFLDAYRTRLLQCLLLEDLEEIDRYSGFVQLESAAASFASPAQFRIYRSNLAVLPDKAAGLNWRLADIDGVDFDEGSYKLELRSGAELLVITRLAKRTTEFVGRLRAAIAEVADKSSQIIQDVFPFLSPDQFQAVAALMKEGHSAAVAKIGAVHPRIVPVLMENTVDAALKPYVETLKKRMASSCDFFAGFKMIRPEEEAEKPAAGAEGPEQHAGGVENLAAGEIQEDIPEDAKSEPGEKDAQEEQVLHWFFFPFLTRPDSGMPANVVAWEAASHTGRATYFFRVNPGDGTSGDIVTSAVQRLNRALVLINFRREPVYLSDDALVSNPRYRHYAIACRRLPILRELRASYIGRAIHSTQEAWLKQVEAILARA